MSNSNPSPQEVMELVEELNSHLQDVGQQFPEFVGDFRFSYYGDVWAIDFLDVCIWDSDNDDRREEDESEEVIPLRQHILEVMWTTSDLLRKTYASLTGEIASNESEGQDIPNEVSDGSDGSEVRGPLHPLARQAAVKDAVDQHNFLGVCTTSECAICIVLAGRRDRA